MCAPTSPRPRSRRAEIASEDDNWVDRVADQVQDRLRHEGLELELLVFYDRITEMLHAVGFDGSPARYFRSMEGAREEPGGTPAPREPTAASLAQAASSPAPSPLAAPPEVRP